MPVKIRRRCKTDEVQDQICRLVIMDRLKDGDLLPSESLLCEQFGVSRITARRAVAKLASAKVLRTEHGRGSFVLSADRAKLHYGKDVLNRRVAIILPALQDGYFGSIAQAFVLAMKKAGFDTIVNVSFMKNWTEQDYLDELTLTAVDGIALCPFESAPLSPVVQALIASYRNVVIFNEPLEDGGIVNVSSDDVAGAWQAVKYLLSLGHRRIGCIPGPGVIMNSRARLQGYRDAMFEAGAFRPELVAPEYSHYHEARSKALIKALLEQEPRPTALFCATDFLARNAIQVLQEMGLKTPDEISVIGFGDTLSAVDRRPQLSSVNQHGEQVGQKTAEVLLDLIFRRELACRNIRVPVHLAIRESCAPPPRGG